MAQGGFTDDLFAHQTDIDNPIIPVPRFANKLIDAIIATFRRPTHEGPLKRTASRVWGNEDGTRPQTGAVA